jgi:hypothetical protein
MMNGSADQGTDATAPVRGGAEHRRFLIEMTSG